MNFTLRFNFLKCNRFRQTSLFAGALTFFIHPWLFADFSTSKIKTIIVDHSSKNAPRRIDADHAPETMRKLFAQQAKLKGEVVENSTDLANARIIKAQTVENAEFASALRKLEKTLEKRNLSLTDVELEIHIWPNFDKNSFKNSEGKNRLPKDFDRLVDPAQKLKAIRNASTDLVISVEEKSSEKKSMQIRYEANQQSSLAKLPENIKDRIINSEKKQAQKIKKELTIGALMVLAPTPFGKIDTVTRLGKLIIKSIAGGSTLASCAGTDQDGNPLPITDPLETPPGPTQVCTCNVRLAWTPNSDNGKTVDYSAFKRRIASDGTAISDPEPIRTDPNDPSTVRIPHPTSEIAFTIDEGLWEFYVIAIDGLDQSSPPSESVRANAVPPASMPAASSITPPISAR